MILNLSILIAKLRGRKTMILGRKSKLMWSARIYNLQDSDTKISVGGNCVVRGELLTFSHGGEISIGHKCYIGEGVRIWSGSRVTIGNFVMIAHGVSIMDNLTHPLDHLARRDQFHSLLTVGHPADIKLDDKPVFIDDDAWIGVNSVILRGVKIGKRAIVGAGSVVVDDVPDDHIVAGNPARLIRVNNQKSTAD